MASDNDLVARAIERTGLPSLRSLSLPSDLGLVTIEHIVMCRSGLKIIETLDLSGTVSGSPMGAFWTHRGDAGLTKFANPVRTNFHHLQAIANLLAAADAVVSASGLIVSARNCAITWPIELLITHVEDLAVALCAEPPPAQGSEARFARAWDVLSRSAEEARGGERLQGRAATSAQQQAGTNVAAPRLNFPPLPAWATRIAR